MFYDEHTWGAHNSISQPGRQFVERQWEIKESYATRANLDARNLLARGCNRLAQQIAVDGSSILAFNWQNRPRTAPLEVEIGSGEQLVDLADNKPVPMDIYFEQDGWRKVRFIARDVPAMGYKAYAIRGLDAGGAQAQREARGRHHREPVLPADGGHANRRAQEPLRQDREPRAGRRAGALQAQRISLRQRAARAR